MNDKNVTPKEGMLAKEIEKQTAQLPSDLFLWLSGAAMATSLCFKMMKRSHTALFLGQWASPFLLMGIYNKIVKTQGHDQTDTRP